MIPLQDQILQKLRAIIGLVELEDSHTSVVSFFHDAGPRKIVEMPLCCTVALVSPFRDLCQVQFPDFGEEC